MRENLRRCETESGTDPLAWMMHESPCQSCAGTLSGWTIDNRKLTAREKHEGVSTMLLSGTYSPLCASLLLCLDCVRIPRDLCLVQAGEIILTFVYGSIY